MVAALASVSLFLGADARATVPGDYPIYHHVDYDRGYDDGYTIGQPAGYVVGFEIGLDRGETEGTFAGETEGFHYGWAETYQPAYDAAYDRAVPIGQADGHIAGFDVGLQRGFRYASEVYRLNGWDNGGEFERSGVCILFVDSNDFDDPVGDLAPLRFINPEPIDLATASYDDGFDDGHSDGYGDGKYLGARDGYDEAFAIAYAIAYEPAFDEGLFWGDREGSQTGNDDGYYDGWEVGISEGDYIGFLTGTALFVDGGTLEQYRDTAYLSRLPVARLAAVPEPSSLWLSFLAVAALAGRHRNARPKTVRGANC